jgi:hypothetical protein
VQREVGFRGVHLAVREGMAVRAAKTARGEPTSCPHSSCDRAHRGGGHGDWSGAA